jgi:uncharacterized protein
VVINYLFRKKSYFTCTNSNLINPNFMKLIQSLFIILIFFSFNSLSVSALTGPEKIKGTFLGELVIPNQLSLRMGIIISIQDDNSLSSVLNIIDQSTGNIPCEQTIFRNDSVIVRLTKLGIEIAGSVDPAGNSLDCQFRQRGGVFPIAFTRVDKLPELLRPQEPKPPFPYLIEEVVFENKDAGLKLSGTLTIPDKPGKYPAVIMVTGSGKQDRNEEFSKHKPFWVIADHLTRKGFIVLRYDDRGVGKSTGNFDKSSTGDFAKDTEAGMAYLKTRKDVNSRKIGIIGHSEGGMVAAIVANETTDVAFIVSLAGFMVNFEDVVLDQLLNQAKQMGRSEAEIALEKAWRKSLYNIIRENADSATTVRKLWEAYNRMNEEDMKKLNWPKGRQESQVSQLMNPWWRYNLTLDNREKLMNIKCPVLALYGDLDKQVFPDQNIGFVEEAFKNGKCKKFELIRLQGLNHMFQTATTGSEYEYTRIEETFSPDALNLISDWLGKTTGR